MRELNAQDLRRIERLSEQTAVALSPDGRYVAYATYREEDAKWAGASPPGTAAMVGKVGAHLWVAELSSGQTRAVAPSLVAWAPTWSPDGGRLAFFGAENGAAPVHLHCWDPGTEELRRFDSHPVQPRRMASGRPRWLGDGLRVCFPAMPERTQGMGAGSGHGGDTPGAAPGDDDLLVFHSPEVAGKPRAAASDPALWADIAVADARTGEVELLTRGLPAYNAYPAPHGEALLWDEWPTAPDISRRAWHSALHLRFPNGRDVVATTWDAVGGVRHAPVWHPDGSAFALAREGIALVWRLAEGGLEAGEPQTYRLPGGRRIDSGFLLWNKEGTALITWSDGRIWCVPITGTQEIRALEVPGRRIVSLLHRRPDGILPGQDLIVLTRDPETLRHGVFRLRLDGSAEVLDERDWSVAGQPFHPLYSANADMSTDGRRFVFCAGDSTRPSALWWAEASADLRGPVGPRNPRLDGVRLGRRRRFAFRSTEGRVLSATVLLPVDWQPGRPCPTLVDVYPDSPGAGVHDFDGASVVSHQVLASRGYAVLSPAFPYDSKGLADPAAAGTTSVLPAVDEAIRLGYADPDRLVLAGQSYGGYAVLALLTRTARFRAAIAVAPIADLGSMYGAIPRLLAGEAHLAGVEWCEDHQGGMGAPPWERPLRYLTNSPVFQLDRVTTPLMLIAGGQDSVVPWSQAAEVFAGMRRLGRQCTFVVYPAGGHGLHHLSTAGTQALWDRVLRWLADAGA